jgi:hypothetical protein
MEAKDTEKEIWNIIGTGKDKDIQAEELLNLTEISFKAGEQEGRQEVVEWTEQNILYVAINGRTGKPELSLRNNAVTLGERWQTQCKEWGIKP